MNRYILTDLYFNLDFLFLAENDLVYYQKRITKELHNISTSNIDNAENIEEGVQFRTHRVRFFRDLEVYRNIIPLFNFFDNVEQKLRNNYQRKTISWDFTLFFMSPDFHNECCSHGYDIGCGLFFKNFINKLQNHTKGHGHTHIDNIITTYTWENYTRKTTYWYGERGYDGTYTHCVRTWNCHWVIALFKGLYYPSSAEMNLLRKYRIDVVYPQSPSLIKSLST